MVTLLQIAELMSAEIVAAKSTRLKGVISAALWIIYSGIALTSMPIVLKRPIIPIMLSQWMRGWRKKGPSRRWWKRTQSHVQLTIT
ncbi:hypothetical protein GDO86_000702 [Hymenochirus boettgeri]|uniref:Uncharacterized protein n=1 Tax=Hymenochirus boettgeri TaxID=247094 RepID=A0A8T2KBX4_9PIPI|nr:hypothetical protein GDO86_000702 [Hymenochirus boettgeri]